MSLAQGRGQIRSLLRAILTRRTARAYPAPPAYHSPAPTLCDGGRAASFGAPRRRRAIRARAVRVRESSDALLPLCEQRVLHQVALLGAWQRHRNQYSASKAARGGTRTAYLLTYLLTCLLLLT